MKYKLLLLIFCLLATMSQAGSILSSDGLGIPAAIVNGRSLGMGGVSIAVPDAYDLNKTNPAGLYMIEYSRFSIQYMYELNSYQTNQGSAHSPRSNFDGFMFGVPIASRAALAFSLQPYSRVNYKTLFSNQVNETSFDQVFSGSGGLNSLNLSGSYKIMNALSIGITGHFFFGRIEKNWLVDFAETEYHSTLDTYATQIYGTGATFGMQYRPLSNVMIGATLRPTATLDTKTYFDYKSIVSSTTYLHYRDTLNGNIHLPASVRFGLGWHINAKWLLGSDLIYSDWKNLQINNVIAEKMHSTLKYALGCEYTPSRNPFASLFNKTVYRAGFSYAPFYEKDSADKSIHEWMITTGIGIPIWNNSSRANIAIAYGQRGSLINNGLSEKLMRIMFSLDAGEKWFVRR